MTPHALVTGGTSGIGRGLARDLVDHGYAVHFVGRDPARGQSVQAELRARGGDATFVPVDLARLRDVQRFTEQFRASVPRLDLLVCSAGVLLPTEQRTDEGHEVTFALACFGVQLLCRQLTPCLAAADHARIVTVSGRPRLVLDRTTDLDALDSPTRYRGLRTAVEAMHTKTVLTQCLAERLVHQGIDVNAFHPGPVRSDLGRSLPWPLRAPVRWVMGRWPEVSATGIYACRAPKVRGTTGALFVGTEARPLAFPQAYREALWERVAAIVDETLGS